MAVVFASAEWPPDEWSRQQGQQTWFPMRPQREVMHDIKGMLLMQLSCNKISPYLP